MSNVDNIDSKDFDTRAIKFDDIPAGWDGFVDPEGNFYKTKPIGKIWYNGTAFCHIEFAAQYLREQNVKILGNERDYLINIMGWCGYGHLTLSRVDAHVNTGEKLTKQQEKTLFKLFELNNDNMEKYYELLDLEEKYE